MTGWWLASYLALWVFVVGLLLLQVGTLREMGVLRRSMVSNAAHPDNLGPRLGAELPTMELVSARGDSALFLGGKLATSTLLAFLAPGCKGCQKAAELLEQLVQSKVNRDMNIRVVLCGSRQASESFLSVYSLEDSPAFDEDYSLAESLGVRMYPSALFYNRNGVLVRKGMINNEQDLKSVVEGPDVREHLTVS